MLELVFLFTAAFLAATLLPAQSEAVLVGLVLQGKYEVPLLVAVATGGNVLGSVVSWAMGRFFRRFRHHRFFPVKRSLLRKASRFYGRYGHWTLLGSWIPIVGDPLVVVAGLLRCPFWIFLILVSVGKLGRYVALVALL